MNLQDTVEAQAVREEIAKILSRRVEEISLRHRLTEDLGMDSLDLLKLLTALEERFRIRVLLRDAEGIATVADAVALLMEAESKN